LYFCTLNDTKMNENPKFRTITLYKDYFEIFFAKQRQKVKDKILWTLKLIEEVQFVPETYLKHLTGTDGIYEVRVQSGSDIFRILCFFDDDKLIVLANGFQKKTQKTPKEEIKRAIKIKAEYDNDKK
jgi:phage-related protein